MPTAVVGSGSNSIGMTEQAWQSCFDCDPATDCISVSGGSVYDQFSAFRGQTIAATMSSAGMICTYIDASSVFQLSQDDPSKLSVSCRARTQGMSVSVYLSANVFSVSKVSDGAAATISGVAYRTIGGGVALVANTSNNHSSAANFQLQLQQCCTVVSNSSTLQCQHQSQSGPTTAISPGSTAEVRSDVLTGVDPTAPGGCAAALVENGAPQQYLYAAFPVANSAPPPPGSQPVAPPPPVVESPDSTPAATRFAVGFSGLTADVLSTLSVPALLVRCDLNHHCEPSALF